jgi:hypothetical protein
MSNNRRRLFNCKFLTKKGGRGGRTKRQSWEGLNESTTCEEELIVLKSAKLEEVKDSMIENILQSQAGFQSRPRNTLVL